MKKSKAASASGPSQPTRSCRWAGGRVCSVAHVGGPQQWSLRRAPSSAARRRQAAGSAAHKRRPRLPSRCPNPTSPCPLRSALLTMTLPAVHREDGAKNRRAERRTLLPAVFVPHRRSSNDLAVRAPVPGGGPPYRRHQWRACSSDLAGIPVDEVVISTWGPSG